MTIQLTDELLRTLKYMNILQDIHDNNEKLLIQKDKQNFAVIISADEYRGLNEIQKITPRR